ncbi:MAG: tetratricopeptide repeat protein, partial [Bacteroidetes bacterium]|nr:tetratricopeptide repeat protein [Bacteroidota bacterium]
MAQIKQKHKKSGQQKTTVPRKKTEEKNRNKFKYENLFIVAAILALTYITYSFSLKNGFTNWDDPGYITENSAVWHLNYENLKIFFTEFFMGNYHPLTMLSFALDYNSAGINPYRYHLVNMLFHLFNTILVFIFVYRLSGKKTIAATIVALFFAIHPMHVESVAWISERKDVLYAFFFIAALLAYHKYNEKKTGSLLFLFFTFILFVLSALCKPAAVTLPVLMLLIDFYLKRKFDLKCILEKVPFFIIAIIFGIISIKAQASSSSITEWGDISIIHRIIFASYGFITYIFKLVFPFNLSAFYPYPTKIPITVTLPFIYYIAPFIVAGLFFLIYKSLKISRVYAFGFLFYFINIALVLQFISVGSALIADRYTYISSLGIAFIAGMEADRVYKNKKNHASVLKYIISGILLVMFVVFTYLTYQRTKVWKNNGILWTDVIVKYPGQVDVAYKNRGNYYSRETKEYEKALLDYNSFMAINPYDASVYSNRGNLYALMKRTDLSINDYKKALSIDSTYYDAYLNRGITYMNMGEFDMAVSDMRHAINLYPDKIEGYKNRAFCYMNMKKNEESIKDYNYVISIEPDNANNYLFRGVVLYNSKKYQEALADFNKIIQLDPNIGEAYDKRSQTFNKLGDFKNALEDALKAQQMGQKIKQDYIDFLKNNYK